MNENREPLRRAPYLPVLSRKTDKTIKLRRYVAPPKEPLTQAAAPKFVPEEKPTGAHAIHVKAEKKARFNIAAAPEPLSQDFVCRVCGQRRTSDGCLCKLLV